MRSLQQFRPYAVAFSACLGSVSLGWVIGYAAPAIPDLNTHPNPFHLSTWGVSLVTSLASIGGLIGGPLGGMLLDRYGRKFTLMMMNLPSAVGWAMIVASPNMLMMCAGRFLCGLHSGIVDVAVPVYIAETSPAKIRGLLCTGQAISSFTGGLLVYVFSHFLPWNWLPIAGLGVTLLTVLCMSLAVESPRWLLAKGYKAAAAETLQWLRAGDADEELTEIEHTVKNSAADAKFLDLFKPSMRKPMLIIAGLFFIQQFSGCGVIPSYLVTMLQQSTDFLDPRTQTVIFQASGLLTTIVSANMVDDFGRRTMLCLSASIIAVGVGGMALFLQLEYSIKDFDDGDRLSYLPITFLVIYNIGYCLGYAAIPFFIASELLPLSHRGIASGIGIMFIWCFTFVNTFAYPHLVGIIHDHGVFWLFTVIAVLGVAFPLALVPETKGKRLEEIEKTHSAIRTATCGAD